MALVLGRTTARITGTVTLAQVEPLAQWLRSTPEPKVNLRGWVAPLLS